jgi:PPK2 family polyphosphate:nucleotide phosphotransferase
MWGSNLTMIDSDYLVRPGEKVKLGKIATDSTGPFNAKEDASAATADCVEKLGQLQEVLYAQGKHSLLIILQAMDTGGKDGAIEHVFSAVNPQGCIVSSFKAPSSEELSHDYLWRIHQKVPPRGMIGIFNRSHYESVLVERVKGLAPKEVWSRRYEHINQFENMLTDEGVTIIKLFLHISKGEQKRRLESRLSDPKKHWKFNPGDLIERKQWGKYMRAYDDAIERCSTRHAPWYVVPSDKKWFRNWVISDTIMRTMQSLHLKYPTPPTDIRSYRVT